MSLLTHLVERALEGAGVVEPVVDPSPLGPPVLGPSEAPSFDEVSVEIPAARGRTPSEVATPRRAESLAPTPVPERSALREPQALASRELQTIISPSPSPTPPLTTPPLAAPPLTTQTQPRPRDASPTVIVEHEPASVIVERRVEQRIERTHETVRESRLSVETRSVEAIEPVVRVREVPVEVGERRRKQAPQAAGEPKVVVGPSPSVASIAEPLRPAAPAREQAAMVRPAASARREAPMRQAAASPVASRQSPVELGPTLRIEIGRVIVRAETPTPQKRAASAPTRPLTTLAEYLSSRDRGER